MTMTYTSHLAKLRRSIPMPPTISSHILRSKHSSSCGMVSTVLCQVLVTGPFVDLLAHIAGLPALLAAPALPFRLQHAEALAPALRKLCVC